MAFKETFTDLRARRRIPMRLFKDRVGINPSYIHGIEQEGFVPSSEKLQLLASVFVEVAEEQEAIDPRADARKLLRERDRIELVGRLGFDPELTEILLVVREMDAKERAELMGPLRDALTIFALIGGQERGGAAKLLARIRSFVESNNTAATRSHTAAELAQVITDFLDAREDSPGGLEPTPEGDLQTPA